MSKINDEDLEDYRLYVEGIYSDYLQRTEKRDISYGEIAHIQSLSKKELEELDMEIDEELYKLETGGK